MIRSQSFPIPMVFEAWEQKMYPGVRKAYFPLNGVEYKRSPRIELFYEKGITCVRCGLEGQMFHAETHSLEVRPHLNMYGYKDGEEILFTKDHILPASKGGANELDNYQTMCAPCNWAKGNREDW